MPALGMSHSKKNTCCFIESHQVKCTRMDKSVVLEAAFLSKLLLLSPSWEKGRAIGGGTCEDRIRTGPPRARIEVVSVELG